MENFPTQERMNVNQYVAVGDINNNGHLELVAIGRNNQDNYIYIFNDEGELLNTIELFESGTSVVLEDINNDGNLELIVSHWYQENSWITKVYNLLGENLYNFSGGNMFFMPSVADIDNDNLVDIIISSENNDDTNIIAYDINSGLKWQRLLQGEIAGEVVIGNIDATSEELEIVAITCEYGDYCKIHVLDSDGDYLNENWPKTISYPENFYGTSTISLSNMNPTDNNLEILFSMSNEIHVLDSEGEYLNENWPKTVAGYGISSISTADLDDDQFPEIIVGSPSSLNIFNYLGENFIDPIQSQSQNLYPVVSDINVNGFWDIITSSHEMGIYFVDLNNDYKSHSQEWSMFQHDVKHTGKYTNPELNVLLGDVNDDQLVDSFDASLVLNYFVLNEINFENWQIIAADVDCNGAIESYDAALILRYSVGIIDQFPCEFEGRYDKNELSVLNKCINNINVDLNKNNLQKELTNCLSVMH